MNALACATEPARNAMRRMRVRAQATWLWWSRCAVILDTETTDLGGVIVEVGVTDSRGRVLLESLVRPDRPVTEAARAVHGISDDDLATAPTWEQVWPALQAVTRGRIVIAYNADFDRRALTRTCRAHGLPAGRLAATRSWWCLLAARTTVEGRRRRLRGGHRAVDDCQAASRLLADLAWTPGHPRAALVVQEARRRG